MKISELIKRLGGELVAGSGEVEVTGVAAIEYAGVRKLVFAENEAQVKAAVESKAGAVVLNKFEAMETAEKSVVQAKNPRLWFAQAAHMILHEVPERRDFATKVHPTAVLGEDVQLGAGVVIGAEVVIGDRVQVEDFSTIEAGSIIGADVKIGMACRIYPRVVIYADSTLGNSVVVHSGVVLGADGFGYVRDAATGAYTQFPQQGILVIEDDVEIGANSTIDRGALGETRIGRGTKIDNLVHIGHNCKIGEDVIIVALTGISGSCTVGRGAVIAGQVGLGDHVTIGEGVILGGQAGVLSGKTLTNEGHRPGTVFWGTPAKPLQQHLRELAMLARLTKRKGNRD